MAHHYLLCEWHVCSDLPIPELLAWPQAEGDARPADITLTEGEVPADLEDTIGLNRIVKVDKNGTTLVHIPSGVRFLIIGGRTVTVQFFTDIGRASWRLYFLGTVLQYICHQRGVYPLHAASLRIADRAVAIAGHSGDGKSTLALELTRRGHNLISDDLTVLQPRNDMIEIVPAFPRLRLWRESLVAANVNIEGLSRVRPDMEKFVLQPREKFNPTPAKLDIVLFISEHGKIELNKCSRTEAVPLLYYYVARKRVAHLLGRDADLVRFAGQIAAKSDVYHLRRPKQFDNLEEVAGVIEGLCG